ncbi:hypothetical protein F5Y16DRAFT_239908 [Xylariaceae sp. FL0255]|nr:hypothetical protein F5Y16DRAFT_239908 [Xylariaceae sp. FL0255]
MVASEAIVANNRAFASQHREDDGIVGVFAGATSGIGARTLERMMTIYRAPTFYVLGRSSISFAVQRKTLEALNPDANIIFIETDVALISGIDSACQMIKASEKKVDYLYMSPGGLPRWGAQYTKEGLETSFAISYLSRVRLLFNLLPLLNRSARPRVLSVLNGGREKKINEQDIGLEKKWTLMSLVNHTTILNTITFDGIAAKNPNITLIHNAPGLVESDNGRRKHPPPGASLFRRVISKVSTLLFVVVRLFIGMYPAEAGERQTYHLTSDRYGPGSLRVDRSSEIVPDNGAVKLYKDGDWDEKFWQFTLETWDKALSTYNREEYET